MINEIVRDHFKISFTDPDKNGQMVATFSFVDMVALTKRVQAWCGKVLALMEAEGVPGLSIDADRALPLFLSDTAPEAAAVLLIAEAKAAAPVPAAAATSPVAGSVWSAGRCLGAAQLAQPEWLWFAKEETDSIPVARYSFGRWPKVEGAAPYVRADLAVPAPERSAAPMPLAADPAWQNADLVTHLRSYPAAPPDCDALSVGYAADLMQKAADEIEMLMTKNAQLSAAVVDHIDAQGV